LVLGLDLLGTTPTAKCCIATWPLKEPTNTWVLYSLSEVESTEHQTEVIVATSIDGSPLLNDGRLKLVSSGDRKPQC
jgi:hypothetical protein